MSLAISAARRRIRSASRVSFSGDRSRNSIVSRTTPGITFGALGVTSSRPTVPTWRPGSEVTIWRTAIVRCEAASSASCRSAIGVVPGVIREAGDRHLVALDRDDALDHTNRNALAFESAALLDVQLEVAMVRAARPNGVHDAAGIAADLPYRVGAGHAVPDLVHV